MSAFIFLFLLIKAPTLIILRLKTSWKEIGTVILSCLQMFEVTTSALSMLLNVFNFHMKWTQCWRPFHKSYFPSQILPICVTKKSGYEKILVNFERWTQLRPKCKTLHQTNCDFYFSEIFIAWRMALSGNNTSLLSTKVFKIRLHIHHLRQHAVATGFCVFKSTQSLSNVAWRSFCKVAYYWQQQDIMFNINYYLVT